MSREDTLRGLAFRCKLVGMRKIVYCVASSLDGFIAGPNDEYHWIAPDPSFDFAALWARFDTLLMGRKTFEVALTRFNPLEKTGKRIVVVSTTLSPAAHPGATVLGSDFASYIERLKQGKGKDIWLMGGGLLFRSILDLGLVDTVEVAIMPVMLGGGVPLLPGGAHLRMQLSSFSTTPMGIAHVAYAIGAEPVVP